MGKLVAGAIRKIADFFLSLLDIDVTSIVKSIPGGETLLSLFADDTQAERIAKLQEEIADKQKDIDSDGVFETEGNRRRDIEEMAELQKELADLKAQQGSGTVIVNNTDASTVSTNTASTSMPAPIKDTSPPAGSIPQYG